MVYLVNIREDRRYKNWKFQWTLERFEQYRTYLDSIADKLPPRAYEFATANWHYNPEDSRRLHDSVPREFTLRTRYVYRGRFRFTRRQQHGTTLGRKRPFEKYIRRGAREKVLDIYVSLLGAYVDGHMDLVYKSVYSLHLSSPGFPYPLGGVDLLVDEMGLSKRGLGVHHVSLDANMLWSIEFEDFDYQWKPFRREPSVVQPDGTMRW